MVKEIFLAPTEGTSDIPDTNFRMFYKFGLSFPSISVPEIEFKERLYKNNIFQERIDWY